MTVLHLVNTMEWGGVRRHILDLADGLTAYGIRSKIAAWIPPDDGLQADERVVPLPLYGPRSGKKSPSGFLSAVRLLRGMLRDGDVQLLHMHSRYATMLGSIAANGIRVPRLYTAHNTFEDLRWLPWYPEDIIAPAAAVRAQFLEHVRGAERYRLHVVSHGVHIPDLPPVAPDVEARFCFAGRLCEEKGVRVLIEALRLLHADEGNLPRMDIVGDGPLLGWMRGCVEADGFSDAVRFHGYLPDPAPVLTGATALVFPSLRLDSIGYVNLEAMARAVPVIASDLLILRDLVIPETTGLVFPAGDAAALAAILRRACDERQNMRAMGIRARELVRTQHDIAQMYAGTAAVYNGIAGK